MGEWFLLQKMVKNTGIYSVLWLEGALKPLF